MEIPQSFDNFL